MADKTIHSGGGTPRGLIIAIIAVGVFVLGLGLLGMSSGPTDDATPAPATAPAATE